jgi:hypothetical protein
MSRLFYGLWPDVDGRGQTNLLVEQVSHHPPVTAYAIENKSKGLRLVGSNAQKTSFNGMTPLVVCSALSINHCLLIGTSIIVKQVGHAILSVDVHGREPQEYLITFPRLRIDGLWYGSPYIELAETSYIVGNNGWCAQVCSVM